MSAGVSDQRMKGQGNQVSNVPKEHLESGGEDFESWRHQPPTTHTPYVPISTTTDPYNPTGAYYGSTTAFPYQAFGVNDGTWSNGTDPMTFLGGYSHDTYGVDASAFGQPSTFNFFPGNSDYSTWGTHTHNQQRKAHYEEYYRADQQAQNMYTGYTNTTNIGMADSTLGLKTMEKDMQNLGLDMSSQMLPGQTMGQMSVANLSSCGQNDKELGLKVQDQKENLGLNHPPPSLSSSSSAPKKMTWASIASQPAKPQVSSTSTGLKKKGPGMPPPPMVPGKHNMDIGTWDTAKNGPSAVVNNSQPHPQQPTPKTSPEVSSPGNVRPSWVSGPMRVQTQPSVITTRAPLVVPAIPTHHSLMHFSTQQVQHQQQQQQQGPYAGNNLPVMLPHMAHSAMSVPPPGALGLHGVQGGTMLIPQLPLQPNHPVLDELKGKNNYNPLDFDMNTTSKARFFVIKSYSEDDIHRSIKYEIWCSTEHGNKRLDQAFREREKEGSGGSVFLFFSVNGSGHFCGMAQMVSAVDYNSNSSVWSQNKWKGQFRVRWIYVKDVPNVQLRHIRLENNENKPVTNSRDTQEVPQPKGQQVLRILHSYPHSTSIFDDFVHYEKRQEEEDSRKGPAQEMFESAKLQHGHEYEGSGGAGKGHQYQHHNQGGPLNKIHHGGGGGGGGGFRGGEHYHEPTNQRGHPNPNDPNQYREARSGSNREQDGPGHRGTHNMHQKERGESGGRGRGRARN